MALVMMVKLIQHLWSVMPINTERNSAVCQCLLTTWGIDYEDKIVSVSKVSEYPPVNRKSGLNILVNHNGNAFNITDPF